MAILGAIFVFLDFLEFKAFQAEKKLYHISYLPKGCTWTKIENNCLFSAKTVSAIVVLCCGTAYPLNCGKRKLILVLNPAVGVSFLIMIKLINHTAFTESRHFVIVFIFVAIRFN